MQAPTEPQLDVRRHSDPEAALPAVSAVAALLVAALLLVGVVGSAVPLPGLGVRNWLVVLFQLNSGIGDLPASPLRVFNPMDIAVLSLVGTTFLGLWPALGHAHRVWMAIAVVLPFAGIPILLVTHLTGRSAVMGAGLVIAYPIFKSQRYRPFAYLGIPANALLLVGDFATGNSRAPIVAALVGAGYVLLMVWFAWLGARLFESSNPRVP